MKPTTITTAERLAIDGPIGPSTAIVIGIVIALVFAWTLRRESHVLGPRTSLLFWCLRTVAMGVVLWMLLAPAKVLVETSTTRKAIVIATDVSGSMQTVDPAGTADEIKWTLARGKNDSPSATRLADEAAAAMGIALRQLQSAREALRMHAQQHLIAEALGASNDAIQRAREHLQRIAQSSSNDRSPEKIQTLVNRLLKRLDDPELQSFTQLTHAIKRNRAPSQKGWQEGLPDLEHRLSAIRTAMQELAATQANDEGQRLSKADSDQLKVVQNENRLDRVLKSLAAFQSTSLASLQDQADVRFGAFDQAFHWLQGPPVRPGSPTTVSTADGEASTLVSGTDLSAVFETLQRDSVQQPFAAVFLLSDVAHNQSPDKNPRTVAATLSGTPIYVVPIGNSLHARDVTLRSVFAPAVAMRNDDIVIEASLQAHECEGEVCIVQLQQDGTTIDQREILLDSGLANRTVRFERKVATLGTEHFRVVVVPIEGELSADNNERDFEVNVTRNNMKILVADEFPRWEYRYLTQLFRRDPKVECDELLFHPRMIATGRRETTRSLPITVDEWDQYDVVVLGDLPPEHLSAVSQESLAKYLQDRGGTLILIAGSDVMPQAYKDLPLAEILPVSPVDQADSSDPRGFEFRQTAEGRDQQALMIGENEDETRVAWDLVNRYAPLVRLSAWRRPNAAAKTLLAAVHRDSDDPVAEEQRSAFLCWQSVGSGRVVYLSGPETFRLRFLRGDRLHYRFWGQLLRWAVAADLSTGTKFVRIRTDKSRYHSRESIQLTVRLADAGGDAVVTDGVSAVINGIAGSRTVPLTADPAVPGEYKAEIRSMPPGDYQIEPTGSMVEELQRENSQEPAVTTLTIRNEVSSELTETRCDRALAQQIADITGGLVIPPTAMDEIIRLTNLEPIVSEKIQQRPVWVQWKYLWIVFGCLQLEWIIRRRMGLS